MNPAGQVPTVVFEDGRALSESNAITRYLARGSRLLPDDPFVQARIDGWMFWEQNAHEPNVAGARFRMVYSKQPVSAVPEICARAAMQRLIGWRPSSPAQTGSLVTASRSPTSRSSRTRASPERAALILAGGRPSADGSCAVRSN
jgi:hypothetical protein